MLSSVFSLPAISGEFTGKPISLQFTEAETAKILGIIAKFSGKGLMLPDSDLGTTSISLEKVPWDEVLRGIAKSENLLLDISENLIVVSRNECR